MPDPRLNCAAGVCCDPIPPLIEPPKDKAAAGSDAFQATVAILLDLGVPEDLAPNVAVEMGARGIVFLSAELAAAIREIAFPAGN